MADAFKFKTELSFLIVFSISVVSTLGFIITLCLLCKRRRRDLDSYKIDEERGPIMRKMSLPYQEGQRKMSLPYHEGPRKNSIPISCHPPRGESLARRNDTIQSLSGGKVKLNNHSGRKDTLNIVPGRKGSSHSVGRKDTLTGVVRKDTFPVVVRKDTLHSVSGRHDTMTPPNYAAPSVPKITRLPSSVDYPISPRDYYDYHVETPAFPVRQADLYELPASKYAAVVSRQTPEVKKADKKKMSMKKLSQKLSMKKKNSAASQIGRSQSNGSLIPPPRNLDREFSSKEGPQRNDHIVRYNVRDAKENPEKTIESSKDRGKIAGEQQIEQARTITNGESGEAKSFVDVFDIAFSEFTESTIGCSLD
jgi:hypothetical protein